jgi:hypothetical protein
VSSLNPRTGAALLRDVGLMADGPLPFGRPVPARGPGVFLIELPAPLPTAPLELTRLGVWLGRVPTLRLDGEIPTSKALQSRLASFWLPSQTVLYIGATETSIGGRIAAMDKTVLGDRRPHSGGHWLKALRDLSGCRVWWANTDAVDEYEDALLSAFAEGVPDEERLALRDAADSSGHRPGWRRRGRQRRAAVIEAGTRRRRYAASIEVCGHAVIGSAVVRCARLVGDVARGSGLGDGGDHGGSVGSGRGLVGDAVRSAGQPRLELVAQGPIDRRGTGPVHPDGGWHRPTAG